VACGSTPLLPSILKQGAQAELPNLVRRSSGTQLERVGRLAEFFLLLPLEALNVMMNGRAERVAASE
jgi:hypothetical protein